MLLVPFLLLKFTIFPLHDLLVRLPSYFSMQDHVSFWIDAEGYFRKRIVPTIAAKLYLVIHELVLLPTKIALPDISADGSYFSAVKRQKPYSHLSCYILNSEISTDKRNDKLLLSLFGLIIFKSWVDFCHFFLVIFRRYPSLLVLLIALLTFLSFLFILWNWNPCFLFIFRLSLCNCLLNLLLSLIDLRLLLFIRRISFLAVFLFALLWNQILLLY